MAGTPVLIWFFGEDEQPGSGDRPVSSKTRAQEFSWIRQKPPDDAADKRAANM